MVAKHLIKKLPTTDSLKSLCQSLAMLDAIFSPDWEYRYYSFNSKWDSKEMMASMRNGQGDGYFILFNRHGAIIKGFDHESLMTPYALEPKQIWPGVLDKIPDEFRDMLTEPAFVIEDTTFVLWRQFTASSWNTGDIDYPDDIDPDGSDHLLSILDGNPKTYQKFAEEYYEKAVPLSSVQYVYQHQPLTDKILETLNPDISLADISADMEEIGYP